MSDDDLAHYMKATSRLRATVAGVQQAMNTELDGDELVRLVGKEVDSRERLVAENERLRAVVEALLAHRQAVDAAEEASGPDVLPSDLAEQQAWSGVEARLDEYIGDARTVPWDDVVASDHADDSYIQLYSEAADELAATLDQPEPT